LLFELQEEALGVQVHGERDGIIQNDGKPLLDVPKHYSDGLTVHVNYYEVTSVIVAEERVFLQMIQLF
jgi:hypothetical protein